ncbi:TPA: MerR family transcriptional regulator [Staphylococcus delphini]|nr:MerR family transcriptional regulator [Staphylococcus delphini]HEC2160816.1 MerR family transcriptional regulator [Staphylococcus delphini]HEC2180032.1 MerR family transcriptional regulator [Staphylococcus delphini]HEC2189587.1 MerR family transcriptional regulator [Staphylococcus delphini]HEC2200280.1 MerR family transcriptional regulator [Staphylococcus delphini]
MYTIKVVSELTGLSTRSLRYYDEIGLLHPSNSSEAGYRLYSEKDIEQLQQIMIYKNMQLPLEQIKAVLEETTCIEDTLNRHLHYLEQQQQQIDKQIKLIEKQLGGIEMTQKEKFSQLKADTLSEINTKYGEELAQKYTSAQVKAQHEHFKNLTKDEYQSAESAETTLFLLLKTIEEQALPIAHPTAEQAFLAHQNWLKHMVPNYSTDYHQQLADLYIQDSRFSAYYQQYAGEQAPYILNKLIKHYT